MSMHNPALLNSNRRQELAMLAVVGANALLCLGLGFYNQAVTLTLQVSVVCLIANGLAYRFWGGSLNSRLLIASGLVILVALQFQITQSSTVIHGNVYVGLCLLLPYCDWWVIAYMGSLLAAQYLSMPALSTPELPLYVHATSERWGQVADTGVLFMLCVFLIIGAKHLQRRSVEAFEMAFLVSAMGQDGPIRLNLDAVRTASRVGGRLRDVQQRVAAALRLVRETIFSMHRAAEEVGSTSGELLSRTDRTANGLKDAAMSLEQITMIVQVSAQASKQALDLPKAFSPMASQGGEVVAQLAHTRQEIEQSSRKITDITMVIDAIAFQTNILALNAAVEAARAGVAARVETAPSSSSGGSNVDFF